MEEKREEKKDDICHTQDKMSDFEMRDSFCSVADDVTRKTLLGTVLCFVAAVVSFAVWWAVKISGSVGWE